METNHTADLYARLHDAENKLFKAVQEQREYIYHADTRYAVVCGSMIGVLRSLLNFISDKKGIEACIVKRSIAFVEFYSELPVDMFKTYDEWTAAKHHFDDLYAMYLQDATDNSFREWLDAVNVSKSIHGQG